MAKISEYLLSTDSYSKPKVVEDKDALAILLLRLLLMAPGDNMEHPEMGVDIIGRYRYSSEGDLKELNKEIQYQIETYLPLYRTTEVNCVKDGKYIKVNITIDGTLFQFNSNNNTAKDEISLSTEENTF